MTELIILVLCEILILFIVFTSYYESFKNVPKVAFLTADDTSLFLKGDSDGYVEQMTPSDLYARKSKDAKEYIQRISKAALSFSEKDKVKIMRCTSIADEFFMKSNRKVYAYIPWKIALISFDYEEGIPHTRSDIIFISASDVAEDDHRLVSLLIHEKVHIYQRFNRDEVEREIAAMGYQQAPLHNSFQRTRRSNPDINNKMYYDPVTRKPMIFTYTSETPSGINDVSMHNFEIEHPYEKMAYDIANEYSVGHFNKYI